MKHILFRTQSLLLVLLLLLCLATTVFSAEIDLGVTVTSGTDTITVTVDNSEGTNAVLAATPAMLEIACDYETAYVMYDGKILSGFVLDTKNKTITFPVAKGGTYTIHEGAVFRVTFNTNGGSAVAEQEVASGGKITQPAAPTKAGFLFAGWYKEVTLTTQWNFDGDTVASATTLYAKWTDAKIGLSDTTGAGSWNPDIDKIALDAAANAQGDTDDTVELRLTITDLDNTSVPKTDSDAIKALAIGRSLEYLDMTLECSTNGGSFADIGKTNNILLKITVDFDPSGKNNLAVFRYHDGKAELLPTGTYGERFELNQTNKKLTIYARKFSTYAIGYTSSNTTLDTYQFSKGNNSSWAKDSTRNLVFICKAPYNLLSKMTINGQEINLSYAQACDDGTQITLKPDFLKTLARGKYYLELYYKNGGYAVASFQVTRSSGIASTGDLFNTALWGSLLGISAVGVIVLVSLKKRKK